MLPCYHSIFALLCCFFSEVFFLLSILFSFAIRFLQAVPRTLPQHTSAGLADRPLIQSPQLLIISENAL